MPEPVWQGPHRGGGRAADPRRDQVRVPVPRGRLRQAPPPGRRAHPAAGLRAGQAAELLAGDQYKGISSLWRDPAADQLFEVQFHTEVSYHAMVFTAEHTYARLRSARTGAPEEIELEAFQREVYPDVDHLRAAALRPEVTVTLLAELAAQT